MLLAGFARPAAKPEDGGEAGADVGQPRCCSKSAQHRVVPPNLAAVATHHFVVASPVGRRRPDRVVPPAVTLQRLGHEKWKWLMQPPLHDDPEVDGVDLGPE